MLKKTLKSSGFLLSLSLIILSCSLTIKFNSIDGTPQGILDFIYYGYVSNNFLLNTFCPIISITAVLKLLDNIKPKEELNHKHIGEILLTNTLLYTIPLVFLTIAALLLSPIEKGSFIIWGTFANICNDRFLFVVLFYLNTLIVTSGYILLSISLKNRFSGLQYYIFPLIIYSSSMFLPSNSIFNIFSYVLPLVQYNIATIYRNIFSHIVSIVLIYLLSFILMYLNKKTLTKKKLH